MTSTTLAAGSHSWFHSSLIVHTNGSHIWYPTSLHCTFPIVGGYFRHSIIFLSPPLPLIQGQILTSSSRAQPLEFCKMDMDRWYGVYKMLQCRIYPSLLLLLILLNLQNFRAPNIEKKSNSISNRIFIFLLLGEKIKLSFSV